MARCWRAESADLSSTWFQTWSPTSRCIRQLMRRRDRRRLPEAWSSRSLGGVPGNRSWPWRRRPWRRPRGTHTMPRVDGPYWSLGVLLRDGRAQRVADHTEHGEAHPEVASQSPPATRRRQHVRRARERGHHLGIHSSSSSARTPSLSLRKGSARRRGGVRQREMPGWWYWKNSASSGDNPPDEARGVARRQSLRQIDHGRCAA
jgi:hypothetical protein